jgi:hypothetical protein
MDAVGVTAQKITDRYAAYCGDSVEVIKGLPSDSVHFPIFSPPFANLYIYSDSYRDMGNTKDMRSLSITTTTWPVSCCVSPYQEGWRQSIARTLCATRGATAQRESSTSQASLSGQWSGQGGVITLVLRSGKIP